MWKEWMSIIDSLIIIKKEKILIFLSDLGRDPSNNLSIPQTDTREHPANCLVSTEKKSRNVNNIPPINISIHLLNFDPVNLKRHRTIMYNTQLIAIIFIKIFNAKIVSS